MSNKETKFSSWVRQYGVMKLCDAMKEQGEAVTFSGVYQWMRRECEPRARKIRAIVEISNGSLTPSDVLDHFAGNARPTKRIALSHAHR